MHDKYLVVDKRPKWKMSIDLIDHLQQPICVVSIFLMNFAREAVTMIHDRIFMISAVQHDTAGKDDKAGEKNEKHFQAFLAPINKVPIENIAI